MKILLVDDMKTVIMTEKMMLSSEGFEIDMASDGIEALKCVEAGHPDMVLLDMMMPNLDGIETCRKIKNNPDTKHIPVILVTTRGEQSKIKEAFEAGCDDYITKPFNKTTLLSRMRKFLN